MIFSLLFIFASLICFQLEKLKKYDIAIAKLQNKTYQYSWEDDKNFFANFEESLVESATFKVKLELVKSDVLLRLNFNIEGLMELVCDRSLEIFGYPFQTEGLQLLRFSDHSEQLSEELELIPKGTSQINVAYYIFELITLAIPMKKLHPRFQQEQTNDNEAMLLVYSSEKKEDKKTTDTKNIDPRWEELKKLIDNKS